MALLNVQDLRCGYGSEEIIHGLDFEIGPGEIVTVLGPNGCGKSTLVKAILGYLPANTGKITFQNKDITRLKPTARVMRGIGYTPQLENVFRPMSVYENLEMGGYSMEPTEVKKRVGEIIEMFPLLAERSRQKASTLSGGERQVLAMARALMMSPSLLFLDEPSAGLAPSRADEVFQYVSSIASLGTAIVIVEQDVHRALRISGRGYVLVSGQVELEGQADDILHNEQIRKAYLGSL